MTIAGYQLTTPDYLTLAIVAILFVLYWWACKVEESVSMEPDWHFRLGVDDVSVKPVEWSINEVTIRIAPPVNGDANPEFVPGDRVVVEERDGGRYRFVVQRVSGVPRVALYLRCSLVP